MTHTVRISCPGAVYHATSRGNVRQPIVIGGRARALFLSGLPTSSIALADAATPAAWWITTILGVEQVSGDGGRGYLADLAV